MTRLSHRDRGEVPELEPHFAAVEARMGFLPNSQLVMAHKPKLVEAFAAMRKAVYDPEGACPPELLSLVGAAASLAAGCRYCTAHSASNAAKRASIQAQGIPLGLRTDPDDSFAEPDAMVARMDELDIDTPRALRGPRARRG